jgi:predicted aspartyl protease
MSRLETHLARLRNCSAYYGWSEADRVCHLKASLEGNAASLLWELPADCSEQLLLDRLESRFGDREQIERFRFELKTRRRRKGESIQALHQDVCRLLALSYPGETGSLSKIVARDAFLDSLGDPEMRIRILERGASSIEEAFSIAARYESYLAGSADLFSSEESGRRRVRAVNSQPDGAASDESWRRQMEQSVSDLKDGVLRLLQQQSCSSQPVGQSSPASSVRQSAASGGQSSSSGRRPPSRGPTGRCFTCGAAGHFARSCPKSSGDSLASLREIQAGDDRTEVYLSAELHKGGKVIHVDVTLDTGSVYSVLPAKYACDSWLRPTGVKLVAANGTNISVCGRACVKFTVGDVTLSAEVLVSDSVDEFLLGLHWLRENSCLWNFATSTIAIRGREVKLKSRRPLCNVRRVIASDNVVVCIRVNCELIVLCKFTRCT